jgi:hypothetical protein
VIGWYDQSECRDQLGDGVPAWIASPRIGFQQAEQSNLSNAHYALGVGSGDLALLVALKPHFDPAVRQTLENSVFYPDRRNLIRGPPSVRKNQLFTLRLHRVGLPALKR